NLIIEKYPEKLLAGDSYLKLAELYMSIGALNIARNKYRIFINTFPSHKQFNKITSVLDKLNFTLDKANIFFDRSVSRFKEINNLKWSFENISLYDEVIKSFDHIINMSLDNSLSMKAHFYISACYNKQAEYKKEEEAFEIYLKQLFADDKNSALLTLESRAQHLLKKKNFEKAILYFRMIIKHFKGTTSEINASYNLGKIYMVEKKNFEKAIFYFMPILDRSKSNVFIKSEAIYRIANCFLFLDKKDDAIKFLNKIKGEKFKEISNSLIKMIKNNNIKLHDNKTTLVMNYFKAWKENDYNKMFNALRKPTFLSFNTFKKEIQSYDYNIVTFKFLDEVQKEHKSWIKIELLYSDNLNSKKDVFVVHLRKNFDSSWGISTINKLKESKDY
ncbi:MAG: hypothetical protein KAI43_09920, partial [Candidatus Aureabacteria bacterium]|nr:hypothetical protein [Candidatus Auribacterota bacterium]